MIAPARRAAFAALLAIDRGRADLDTAVDHARHDVTDARDLALLHAIVTGTLRWQGRIDWRLAPLLSTPLPRLDPEVRVALRMAAFQLDFLDRTPASAVVDDAVSLVKRARKASAAGLTNAVLRRVVREEQRALPEAEAGAPRATVAAALSVTHAHPEWLVDRWLTRETRAVVEAWLDFDNAEPPIILRVNPLVAGGRESVASRLAAAGVETTPCRYAPLGLVVGRGHVASSAPFLEGACVVQDEGSQLAALIAPVLPGHRVLDVCAAPGGKALAYAHAAGSTGRVVACDVRPRRVTLLADTLRRGGATTAQVVHIGADDPLPFAASFDVVAVDAPCSGLGTLRRDPDIKWRRTSADLLQFQDRQVDLLRRAWTAVAPRGVLVYTTCSTEPEENADVVARFLTETSEAVLRRTDDGPSGSTLAPFADTDGCVRLHPARHGLEGYFGAVLERR